MAYNLPLRSSVQQLSGGFSYKLFPSPYHTQIERCNTDINIINIYFLRERLNIGILNNTKL